MSDTTTTADTTTSTPMERDTENADQSLAVWGEFVSAQCAPRGHIMIHFPASNIMYSLASEDADVLATLFKHREARREAGTLP